MTDELRRYRVYYLRYSPQVSLGSREALRLYLYCLPTSSPGSLLDIVPFTSRDRSVFTTRGWTRCSVNSLVTR
ncbi:MAG TPA: hypothetical protein VFS21_00040 [Roseiflexaceae bacterium]|nr:hypothetical protein [Roseiflexaceae bacterium]